MTKKPLINKKNIDDVLLDTGKGSISCSQLLGLAFALAEVLPDKDYIINFCKSSQNFIVGFLAALIKQKTTLLPHNNAVETLKWLESDFAENFLLTDEQLENLEPYDCQSIPEIDMQQVACVFFTSGSTGRPKSYAKNWGELVGRAELVAEILDLNEAPVNLITSVPLQHLFGFEHIVMLLLQSRATLNTQQIFYPSDLKLINDQQNMEKMLVTTPYHLKCLLESKIDDVHFKYILSSTAPLTTELAKEAELCFAADVIEIYGCTEIGAIATRKTAQEYTWVLLKGIRLQQQVDDFIVSDALTQQDIILPDQLLLKSDVHFEIIGRKSDNLNIAGKRMSLADLNLKLNALPGVDDAVIYCPSYMHDGLRLVAFYVGNNVSVDEIKNALSQQVDAVFIPKYLIKLDKLPHSSTGKINKSDLDALVLSHLDPEFAFKIASNHGAMPGHFPKNPIVPGVLILEKIIGLYQAIEPSFELAKFKKVKFTHKLLPEHVVSVKFKIVNGDVHFEAHTTDTKITSGSFC